MTKSEFITRFNALVATSQTSFDTQGAMQLLTEVSTDYDNADANTTTLTNLKSELEKRDSEITSLRQANFQLFMSIGQNIANSDPSTPGGSGVGGAVGENNEPNNQPSDSSQQEQDTDPVDDLISKLIPSNGKE